MTAADLVDGTAGQLVAGVDEVGRGPLAGDVVAAAVILTDSPPRGRYRLQNVDPGATRSLG